MAHAFWQSNHRLDALTLPGLWSAYLHHATIHVYMALTLVALAVTALYATAAAPLLLSAAFVVVVYPAVWYGLHRYILHGRFLYRIPATALLWKRIHFDHHRDPHDLDVLFGSLLTTLPTIALVTMPVGYAIGGVAGLAAAFATGLVVTGFYEFCHCIQHLKYSPGWRWVQRIKKLHLQHHFHDERSNFGITNYFYDRLFRTFRARPSTESVSSTVFNLGYTLDEVRRYPWVARHTPDIDIEEAATLGVGRRKREAEQGIAPVAP
ncbi:MAG: sterol desaturase family protein [Alphaproteobacteria bacterium]|nr:sterol desaturase family protein [Alphaproteobacteria bacterium]